MLIPALLTPFTNRSVIFSTIELLTVARALPPPSSSLPVVGLLAGLLAGLVEGLFDGLFGDLLPGAAGEGAGLLTRSLAGLLLVTLTVLVMLRVMVPLDLPVAVSFVFIRARVVRSIFVLMVIWWFNLECLVFLDLPYCPTN